MRKNKKPKHWKYKNLILAFLSIVLAIILYRYEAFHSFLIHLGGLGYVGAFVAGVLFVWIFTAATSALILLTLAETLSPIEIGLIAGLGAVVGDLLIFRFVKDGLAGEVEDIYYQVDHKKHLKKLFHSKYFNWMLPVLGALIIASPFPDELGVSLMGISKMGTLKFSIISYVLNSIGIFLIILASVFIKP